MARQINKRKLILLWYLLQGIVLIICFFCVRYGKHELKSPIDSLVIGSILTASSIIGLYTNHWVVFVDFVMILYSIFFALFCFLLVAVASPMLFFAIILILLSVINIIAAVYLVIQILVRTYSM